MQFRIHLGRVPPTNQLNPGPRRNVQPNLGPTPSDKVILKLETGSVTLVECGVQHVIR